MSDQATLSGASQCVTVLQNQADILAQEIFELKKQQMSLQKKIDEKETQRLACLGTAQSFIDYQTSNQVGLYKANGTFY